MVFDSLKKIYFLTLITIAYLFTSVLCADMQSVTGNILFDVDSDQSYEMLLDTTGLGIGTNTPSAKLHVVGNAMIENGDLIVGATAGNSSVHVEGSLGMNVETLSTNTDLSGNSIILADTSNGDFTLNLPAASGVTGRVYTIKKINSEGNLYITGDKIDEYTDITLSNATTGYPYVSMVSNGSQWYVMSLSGNSTSVASDNLINWWKLDETGSETSAADSSGSGNTGTVTSLGSWGEGKRGGALHFGSSTYISVGAGSDYADMAGLTLSAWVYHNGNAADKAIIDKFWDGANRQFKFGLNISSGNLHLDFRIGTDSVSNVEISSGTIVTSEQWHHVAGTWDRSQIAIYLNGVQTQTLVGAGNTILNNSSALKLGRRAVSSGDQFGTGGGNNYLDDLRIYNRALSEDEIKVLAR